MPGNYAYAHEQDHTQQIEQLNVGDGISYSIFTDVIPCTIIYISPGRALIRAQEDSAVLLNGEELKFVYGGFFAHCINQHVQKYEYRRDSLGQIVTFTKRTWIDYRRRKHTRWKLRGIRTHETGGNVYPGRKKFYDYNF